MIEAAQISEIHDRVTIARGIAKGAAAIAFELDLPAIEATETLLSQLKVLERYTDEAATLVDEISVLKEGRENG